MLRSVVQTALATVAAGASAVAFADSSGAAATPNILIVRVPAVGTADDLSAQAADAKSEVFPLAVTIERQADGTVNVEQLRSDILEHLRTQKPVMLDDVTPELADLPDDLRTQFKEAEKQTDDGSKPVVAWRGYGPVRGYHAGVVAYNRSPYRGYYPASTYPYYGYYDGAYGPGKATGGVVYHYHYGVYRRTPSFHYFGYYRH